MLIGAIADDLTGATDLALILANRGVRVLQVVGVPGSPAGFGGAEAVVVSLKSRTIPPDEAVAQSVASAKVLLQAGVKQLFFKYCSTFDSTDAGNIGPVIDALLDLLGETRTLACPAFPANGRTVYKGHLFVHDQLLSESSMRDHPLTPMRDPNLVRVLQRQTRRHVRLVAHEIVAAGGKPLRDTIEEREGISIIDAIDDGDLHRIGEAARGLRLVTGGSAVAAGLNVERTTDDNATEPENIFKAPEGRSVILAGSCSAATLRQIAVAEEAGQPSFRLDPIAIAVGRMTVEDAADFVLGTPADARPLVYSSSKPESVMAAQTALGFSSSGHMIEVFIAELASRLHARGVARFLVAGGETSGAVVNALGIRTLSIGPQIAPGVPWTLAGGASAPIALALKSGNFGQDDIFLSAWDLLT